MKGTLGQLSSIDGTSQQYIWTTLRTRILQLCYYFLLSGNLGKRRLHLTMQQHFCWSHIDNDVYNTAARCHPCTRNRRTNRSQRKLLCLSLADPLRYVSLNILGSLLKTVCRIQDNVETTDWCSKLVKAIPIAKARPQNCQHFHKTVCCQYWNNLRSADGQPFLFHVQVYRHIMQRAWSQDGNTQRVPHSGQQKDQRLQHDYDLKTLTLFAGTSKKLGQVCAFPDVRILCTVSLNH